MTKRILSIIIALTLVISLIPTVVFASETSREPIELVFNSSTVSGNYIDKTYIAPQAWVIAENAGWSIVADETTPTTTNRVGSNGIRVTTSGIGGWVKQAAANRYKMQFTAEKSGIPAGSYRVKMEAVKYFRSGKVYLYVNGQYAGMVEQEDPSVSTNALENAAKVTEFTDFNIITVTEDDSTVKFRTALAEYGSHVNTSNVLDGYYTTLNKIILEPIEDETTIPTVKGLNVDIPDTVELGAPANISAFVEMNDGSQRYINGYDADGEADANNNINVEVSWNDDVLTFAQTNGVYTHNGKITGTLTGNKAGEADVKVTATVGGVPYTYKKTVWVIDPANHPEEFTLQIADRATYDSTNKVFATDGFEILYDKSTANRTWSSINATATTNTTGKKIANIRVRGGSGFPAWPSTNATINKNNTLVIEKNIPVAGWYKVDADGFKASNGGQFAIYANGNYVGDYNFYNSIDSKYWQGETAALNTVYLPSGNVEFTFLPRKVYYDGPAMPLDKLTFTLVSENEADAPKITAVESAIPTIMEIGETQNLTAKVLMNDNRYRSFGYTFDGAIPTLETGDIVDITSSNEKAVSVSEKVCVEKAIQTSVSGKLTEEALAQVIDPTTTTYALTAIAPGTSTITVTAKVGDETKTTTAKITVPDVEAEDETTDANVSFAAYSSIPENSVNVSGINYNGDVDSEARGTEVTVEAPEVEGYKFRYWQRGSASNGKWVSGDAKYTFTLMTNTMLTAVYDAVKETDEQQVEFWNQNGAYITTETVKNGAITKPTATLTGYTFDNWYVNGTDIFDVAKITESITRAVAQYTANAVVGTVKVNGVDVQNAVYNKEIETTAADAKVWYRDGIPVAYGNKYTYYVWDATEITYSTEDVIEKAPLIILEEGNDGAYMIEYDAGDKQIIEAGIVFGNNATIDSCAGKATSQKNLSHGQFTAQSNGSSTARGYIIYKDGTDYKVKYSD